MINQIAGSLLRGPPSRKWDDYACACEQCTSSDWWRKIGVGHWEGSRNKTCFCALLPGPKEEPPCPLPPVSTPLQSTSAYSLLIAEINSAPPRCPCRYSHHTHTYTHTPAAPPRAALPAAPPVENRPAASDRATAPAPKAFRRRRVRHAPLVRALARAFCSRLLLRGGGAARERDSTPPLPPPKHFPRCCCCLRRPRALPCSRSTARTSSRRSTTCTATLSRSTRRKRCGRVVFSHRRPSCRVFLGSNPPSHPPSLPPSYPITGRQAQGVRQVREHHRGPGRRHGARRQQAEQGCVAAPPAAAVRAARRRRPRPPSFFARRACSTALPSPPISSPGDRQPAPPTPA